MMIASPTLNQCHKITTNERTWCIDWHPSGKTLASVGNNKTLTFYSYQSKSGSYTKKSTLPTQHSKTIRSIKFSHAGDKIAVGSFDACVSVWVYNGEQQDYEMLTMLDGHQNQVKCVSWSHDDKKIVSCSRDKNIWVWEFDQISYDYTCGAVLEGHTQDVKFVEWFPNQANKLVSASYDNTIRIWQGDDDDYICQQVLQAHKSIVWNVQIKGDDLFSVSEDCTLIQWVLVGDTGKYEAKRVYEGFHMLPIYACCILNDKYICTGSGDNSICIIPIDTQPNQQSKHIMTEPLCRVAHQSDINCLKTNPKNNRILASCSDDQTIRIWEFKDN